MHLILSFNFCLYAVDTLWTFDQQPVDSWSSVDWLKWIDWKLVNPLTKMLTECLPRCRWSVNWVFDPGLIKGIDQGYQSRVSIASYADALWARHAIFLPHERLLKQMGCLIRPITAHFLIKAANFEPWSIFTRDVVRMADICIGFQRVCETFKVVNLNPFWREGMEYFVKKNVVVFVNLRILTWPFNDYLDVIDKKL